MFGWAHLHYHFWTTPTTSVIKFFISIWYDYKIIVAAALSLSDCSFILSPILCTMGFVSVYKKCLSSQCEKVIFFPRSWFFATQKVPQFFRKKTYVSWYRRISLWFSERFGNFNTIKNLFNHYWVLHKNTFLEIIHIYSILHILY